MIYRILILLIVLSGLAGCSTVTMNGELSSAEGGNLGAAQISAFKQRGLRSYAVKAELPDESVFRGEMKFGEKQVTLYSNDGTCMKCAFEMNNAINEFEGGGTGTCTISDGQNIKVKF